ncbi:GNAT family N-acetyltransferase [Pontibacter harenae]|uniref:GNAT family N-acetyltransferase n=1 Tax=Pontibacter harenae TaxID=2894083 RepID=UPI001E386512|nr:GNAT family N-acetyltransferase [Pontibacter harenae]MCC9166229.1 GNAT family N-acetyltransferase [Pontibacter harenae]
MNIQIRSITSEDNQALASIIRQTLEEFKANKPGTAYYDASTDHLSEIFEVDRSCYFVAELDGKVVGGAGIYPTEGLPEGTCELVRMYLLPETRGKGLGKALMEKCIEAAKNNGYNSLYLETMPELAQAVKVYQQFGFVSLDKPLGNGEHFDCTIWMERPVVA